MPSYFEWIQSEQDLTAAALTVRVQALPYNDLGRLMWETFFPRADIPSVKLRNITTTNFRPVADRREWNARGRLIPLRTPKIDDIEMVPVESYFKIGEREIQELTERTFGNMDLFRSIVGSEIPTRTDSLAIANYRRIEVDAMTAWALGQVTARNPIGGDTVTVGFGYDSTRYVNAGTAWTGGSGGTAYANFITWFRDTAQVQVGPCVGAMMRLSTMLAIVQSAPNQFAFNSTVMPTRGQVEQRIQDELGSPFNFYVNENSLDLFSDGGLEPTRTKVWPLRIAAIPAGLQVGFTGFAPVARAYELARETPEAQIDVRGMTAFTEQGNMGRELTVECQANAFPVPNEQLVSIMAPGI